MTSLVEALLAGEAVRADPTGLSLVFCDDPAIRELNQRYRGRDEPTDVLAFSQDEGPEFPLPGGLGDVVISVETAERQAEASGKPLQEELEWLLLHGALHLLGYDHPNDAAAATMDARARAALRAAGAVPHSQ